MPRVKTRRCRLRLRVYLGIRIYGIPPTATRHVVRTHTGSRLSDRPRARTRGTNTVNETGATKTGRTYGTTHTYGPTCTIASRVPRCTH
jgi:hypothetical protein